VSLLHNARKLSDGCWVIEFASHTTQTVDTANTTRQIKMKPAYLTGILPLAGARKDNIVEYSNTRTHIYQLKLGKKTLVSNCNIE